MHMFAPPSISEGGVPPDTATVLTIRAYDELSPRKPNIRGHAITRVTLENGGAPSYTDRDPSTHILSTGVANGVVLETGKEGQSCTRRSRRQPSAKVVRGETGPDFGTGSKAWTAKTEHAEAAKTGGGSAGGRHARGVSSPGADMAVALPSTKQEDDGMTAGDEALRETEGARVIGRDAGKKSPEGAGI
jgi:hypothetical protein